LKQLLMCADDLQKKEEFPLPAGHFYEQFQPNPQDVADWKRIIMEPPAPKDGADSCYQLMILNCRDIDLEKDIWFVTNAFGVRVATFTTITHADGTGYVHMVKALQSERGKGIGKAMAYRTLSVFAERGVKIVFLTTDDFRISAIKTYLDAGYRPVLCEDPESDMKKRWSEIMNRLQVFDINFLRECELPCQFIE